MEFYSKLSDADLLIFLKTEDRNAFSEIYNRYWSLLYLHVRHMLHNKDAARDIVQEVFLSLWNKSPDLEFTVNLKAYLYKSVRNATLDVIRKDKSRDNYLADLSKYYQNSDFNTDELVNFNNLKELIEKEVAFLPKKMRTVFEMSRNQNLSHAEIAALLNITDHTVKKQINKAIHILRKRLDLPTTLIFLYLSCK